MTLGEKIRKYRLLNNKTQKQLGEDVGFKKSTADVRINQYETNKMAPKADIRAEIASVLNIDLAAISDVCPTSFEDIMYILFELEENLEMKIEKKDGRTYLSFDDNNKNIRTLITYLNMWINQKAVFIPDPETASEEQKRSYELWKSRFVTNINDYFAQKTCEIESCYSLLIENISHSYQHAKKTSEISLLLRKMYEAGLSIHTAYSNPFSSQAGPGFTFTVSELLSPPSEDAQTLFAQFLTELKHFSDLGAEYSTEMNMTDNSLTITYYIPVASFSVIKSQFEMVLEYYSGHMNENDYFKDRFEMNFRNNLETYCNDIEEEIEHYRSRSQQK